MLPRGARQTAPRRLMNRAERVFMESDRVLLSLFTHLARYAWQALMRDIL